jgi:hypothetical protein
MREVIQKVFGLMLGIILSVGMCLAEPIPCVDTLSAAQWGKQLRHIPVDFGVRGFAKREFGDWFPYAVKELNRGRPWVGSNLGWKDNHTFTQDDLKFAKKEIRRYQPLCAKFKGKVEITPFTEHNLKQPLLDKWLDEVQAEAKDCIIINSVWQGDYTTKYKNEVHGHHAKPPFGKYNYSYDGTNAVDDNISEMLEKHKDADVFCVWHPRLNLRWNQKDPANRAQRNLEADERSPTKELLESLVYLFSHKGVFKIPNNWLVKSHAENHGPNPVTGQADLKGDKLLIISPVKSSAIDLTRNGKLIARLPYYGPFDGGGFRYYSAKFGYQAGPDLDVFIGKKKYGTINGGFRGPTFR